VYAESVGPTRESVGPASRRCGGDRRGRMWAHVCAKCRRSRRVPSTCGGLLRVGLLHVYWMGTGSLKVLIQHGSQLVRRYDTAVDNVLTISYCAAGWLAHRLRRSMLSRWGRWC
jgi:hypothetical protein